MRKRLNSEVSNQQTAKIKKAANLIVSGESAIERLGSAIAIADINGDGITDLILGSNGANSSNGEETGTVSVMFGNIFDREPTPEASGTGPITIFAIIAIVAVVIVGGGLLYIRRIRKAPPVA